MYAGIENSASGTIDSYTLLNARLTWSSADDDWQAALECQNLTDELYYVSNNDGIGSGAGLTSGAPGMPRTYLFSIKRSF